MAQLSTTRAPQRQRHALARLHRGDDLAGHCGSMVSASRGAVRRPLFGLAAAHTLELENDGTATCRSALVRDHLTKRRPTAPALVTK